MRRFSTSIHVVVLTFGLILLLGSIANADSFPQQNAVVNMTAGTNTVTITITNTLSNSQVLSIAQNISAVYFQVSGYTGSGVSLSPSSGQTTTISNGTATLGGVTSTGWVAGNVGSNITLCVICASPVRNSTAPDMTIIGGTGSGAYSSANASINNNGPHNPFLVGTVSFTLYVPGVTATSTFSDVVVQFGTAAAPPVPAPEPSAWKLLLFSGAVIFGAMGIRFRVAQA